MTPIYVSAWGSTLYGTNNRESDLDIRGVYIPTIEQLLGLHSYSNTIDFKDQFIKDILPPNGIKIDAVLYSLKHFLNQVAKGSPIAIEMLFTMECSNNFYIKPYWRYIEQENLISQETVNMFLSAGKGIMNRGLKNKDNKELMHAYRIIMEAEMLARSGMISYPFNYYQVNFLKRIKAGVYKADHEKDILAQCEEIIKINNFLPEKTDHDKIDLLCQTIHLEHIKESTT